MKYRVIFILLALAALLCGCGAEAGHEESAPLVSAAAPLPTPEPDPERSLDPVLHYLTTSTCDPETGIRRTTLDPQGTNFEAWFERPVFEETGEGYQRINAFFDELEQRSFTPENEALVWRWECEVDPDDLFYLLDAFPYRWDAVVGIHTDRLVSVCIYEEARHPGEYISIESYTFRTDTGEPVKLTDLVDESEEELKEIIAGAVREEAWEEWQYLNEEYREYGPLKDYGIDDFDFFVREDGTIWINFDVYEAACGARGAFSVDLPVTLSPKF